MTTGPDVTFTYQNWMHTPEDGLLHEVLAGEHVVTPLPNVYHQRISRRILIQLDARTAGRGEVFHAPTGVRLSDADVVEPDLLMVLSERADIVKANHVDGPPDLVVEILSRSTGRRDRGIKKRRYGAFGVPEYWIVDPVGKVVEQYGLESGSYRLVGRHPERICLRVLPEAFVDLIGVW